MANPDAMILVHGIGDQKQHSTLMAFMDSLVGLGLAPPSKTQTLHTAPVETASATHTYFVDRRSIAGRDTVVAEMFWSDLSPVRTGFMASLLNFFQLISDAPDIVYAALGPRNDNGVWKDNPVLRVIRSVFALAFWVIYFPIIAFNIAYAILILGFGIHNWRDPARITIESEATLTALITAAVAIPILLLIKRLDIGRYLNTIFNITIFSLLLTAALCYYHSEIGDTVRYRHVSDRLNFVLALLWLIPIIASAAFLALLPALMIGFSKRRKSFLLAFATGYIIIRFWLLLISSIWLIFLANFLDLTVFESLIAQIKASLRLLSLVTLDVIVIAIAFVSAVVAHTKQSKIAVKTGKARTFKRLIIPLSVPIAATVLSIIWVAAIYFCNCDNECVYQPCTWMNTATARILINATLVLGLAGAFLQLLEGGFDVAGDIVNYFKSNIGHRIANPFYAMASVFNYKPYKYENFGQLLQQRLEALGQNLSTEYGPFARVCFVTHSLGSMIAIDTLRKTQMNAGGVEVSLVTMGSPYKNIFNYYFPHLFPPLYPQDMPALTRWMNIYRANDYVGGAVSFEGGILVQEREKSAKGHLGYFTDPEVMVEFKDWLKA
ncbi:MAG: hypothetical protein SGJ17_03050 [Hyphomicrobiales bacterium]|nr:hypothetical protein [Hyphomicrobiales bacterium]